MTNNIPIGGHIALGLGLGVFTSLFVFAAGVILRHSWQRIQQTINKETETSISSLIILGIIHIFYMIMVVLCLITPFYIGLILVNGVWLIPLLAYLLAILYWVLHKTNCLSRIQRNIEGYLPHNKLNVFNEIVWNWLDDIDLTEYHHIFVLNGYTTLNDLSSIKHEDLTKLNIINSIHIQNILAKTQIKDSININIQKTF